MDPLKAWIAEAKKQIESGHYKPDVIDVKMLIRAIEDKECSLIERN